MNLKCSMLLEEYKQQKENYKKLEDVIQKILIDSIKKNNIIPTLIEHRIKTEESFKGKLELKSEKYNSIEDITDILGVRIVLNFSDEVDIVCNFIKETFSIDYDNSIDKRKLLDVSTFGYLSVHYICFLPDDGKYPSEICNKKFEIQIRSALQHVWATCNHDLAYKTDFGIPKHLLREFYRLAGLFELADEQLVRIRDSVNAYTENIRQKIKNNEAKDLQLDRISLNEYVNHNLHMKKLLKEISLICNSEILTIDSEPLLIVLQKMGKSTIGDLEQMLSDYENDAMKLAKLSLENTDLDILSSTIGLRYLCQAEIKNKKYSFEKVVEILNSSLNDEEKATKRAERLFRTLEKL